MKQKRLAKFGAIILSVVMMMSSMQPLTALATLGDGSVQQQDLGGEQGGVQNPAAPLTPEEQAAAEQAALEKQMAEAAAAAAKANEDAIAAEKAAQEEASRKARLLSYQEWKSMNHELHDCSTDHAPLDENDADYLAEQEAAKAETASMGNPNQQVAAAGGSTPQSGISVFALPNTSSYTWGAEVINKPNPYAASTSGHNVRFTPDPTLHPGMSSIWYNQSSKQPGGPLTAQWTNKSIVGLLEAYATTGHMSKWLTYDTTDKAWMGFPESSQNVTNQSFRTDVYILNRSISTTSGLNAVSSEYYAIGLTIENNITLYNVAYQCTLSGASRMDKLEIDMIDRKVPEIVQLPTTGATLTHDMKYFSDTMTLNAQNQQAFFPADVSQINKDKSGYIFQNVKGGTPIPLTITAAEAAGGWATIPAGKYNVTFYAEDNATNPAVSKIVDGLLVNLEAPVITEGAYDKKWTNKPVTVPYTVTSDATGLVWVKEDGTDVLGGAVEGKQNKTINTVYNSNGSKVITAESGLEVQAVPVTIKVVNIDLDSPVIDLSQVPKTGTIEAVDIKKASLTDALSGIKDGTDPVYPGDSRVVYFYDAKTEALVKTITFDQLDNEWKNIPAGNYTYIIGVSDKAGNYIDSKGNRSDTGKPEKPPVGPGEGPVTINAVVPVINHDPIPTTWTNKNVVINYNVASQDTSNLKNVTETKDGTSTVLLQTGKTATGSMTFEKNGTGKLEATTVVDGISAAPKNFTVANIDKKAPAINVSTWKSAKTLKADMFDDSMFSDLGDTGASDASGIRDGKNAIYLGDTRIVYLYNAKTGAFVKEISWTDLKAAVASKDKTAVPAGSYKYILGVVDCAGNYADSTGFTSGNGKPEKPPVGPGDGPIGINAEGPTVTGEYYNKDGSVYNKDWTNQDIDLKYEVNSDIPLDKVTIDGAPKTPSDENQDKGTLTFDGSQKDYTIYGENSVGDDTGKFDGPKIDKIAPTIEVKNDFKDKVVDGSTIKDAITVGDKGGSDVKEEILILIPVDGGPNIVVDLSKTPTEIDAIISGASEGGYKFIVVGKDGAGNYKDTTGKEWTGTGGPSAKPTDPNPTTPPTTGEVVYLNPSAPTIVETGRKTVSGKPLTQTQWTNEDVIISYTATSKIPLKNVKVDGNGVTVPSNTKTLTGTHIAKEYRDVPGEATNIGDKTGTDRFPIVYIDRLKPEPKIPASGDTFAKSDFDLSIDATATLRDGKSEVKTISVVAKEYIMGIPSGSKTYTSQADLVAGIADGKTYDFTFTITDNAGNVFNQTVTNVKIGSGGGGVIPTSNLETKPGTGEVAKPGQLAVIVRDLNNRPIYSVTASDGTKVMGNGTNTVVWYGPNTLTGTINFTVVYDDDKTTGTVSYNCAVTISTTLPTSATLLKTLKANAVTFSDGTVAKTLQFLNAPAGTIKTALTLKTNDTVIAKVQHQNGQYFYVCSSGTTNDLTTALANGITLT